jgi:hypothetical protein
MHIGEELPRGSAFVKGDYLHRKAVFVADRVVYAGIA